ncbi:hypothetical protein BACPEC_00725 [[Bacteroides] pectinophilus ATCC 43243]|uniref:UPF0297 protein BACPEC_00725 n=2 Tax=[Bacteroides] pectinophilus TaxID=384638 RepID=B7APW9_9FIRM|nr:hypothetical protein BACPEC_00725 [[Bacteroides] pectinophilus ATCC 43243]
MILNLQTLLLNYIAYNSRKSCKIQIYLCLYFLYIYIRIHSEFKRRNVIDMLDNNTRFFKTQPDKTISVEEILEQVYLALKEKGYNPVNQIVGYIMSGDPTYITSHNNARSLIMKVERDELVEEVIRYFIEGKGL